MIQVRYSQGHGAVQHRQKQGTFIFDYEKGCQKELSRWGNKDGKNEKARQWELNYKKTNHGNCHSDRMNTWNHCHKTIGEVLGMEFFYSEVLVMVILPGRYWEWVNNYQWGKEDWISAPWGIGNKTLQESDIS